MSLRKLLRSALWRGFEALSAPPAPPESKPAMPRYEVFCEFLRSLDMPDDSARRYLAIHLDRIATTLGLVPPPARTGHALELGTYMHMAPAVRHVLGYREVRGAYYGQLGHSDLKRATVNGELVCECWVDLFNAEKDLYPYPDASFDCVLACEIFEHLLHDPMHMLFECRRVLDDGGTLILTTPNVVSATAVARVLEMSGNPQLYSKYTDPRAPYAETEVGHMREYTPKELEEALHSAGFQIEWLFTTYAPGYESYRWITKVLRAFDYRTALRGEQMYCSARKVAGAATVRYPGFLYEG